MFSLPSPVPVLVTSTRHFGGRDIKTTPLLPHLPKPTPHSLPPPAQPASPTQRYFHRHQEPPVGLLSSPFSTPVPLLPSPLSVAAAGAAVPAAAATRAACNPRTCASSLPISASTTIEVSNLYKTQPRGKTKHQQQEGLRTGVGNAECMKEEDRNSGNNNKRV